jgi:hypothetical protein
LAEIDVGTKPGTRPGGNLVVEIRFSHVQFLLPALCLYYGLGPTGVEISFFHVPFLLLPHSMFARIERDMGEALR